MSETQAPAETQALFYKNPRPLTAATHGTWRVKLGGMAFAAQAQWVPVVVTEFVEAGHSYPLLFAGKDHMPVALLGLTPQNRFVKDGVWRAGAYVPAYVARYPFALGKVEETFGLAIDTEAPQLVKSGTEGEPLFVDGKPSRLALQAVGLCEKFSNEYDITQLFVKLLEEHRLLVERVLEVTLPQGRKTQLTGFSLVDTEAFKALPDALLGDWHRRNLLAPIYAHLSSLTRIQALRTP